MIDLSVIVYGNTVVHRNGGRSVVYSVQRGAGDLYWLALEGRHHAFLYTKQGYEYNETENSPFDIVEIEA